ncbi:MAG: TonB-dependent siderophore receptor [Sphingopyxis sp.]|uniref:TonB-dependent siderophore receptor n=1 Tax=Sphingopyxis sp. TaxID=1908224 RepID=UPI002AB9A5E8|nr:TonB-dependent siderophore receptor [Sphingopyxis sp.]MDZ3832680.1 TonB-dependent siderophore receptor [Sphingopyxis sp.]
MRFAKLALLGATALGVSPAFAAEEAADEGGAIVVTGERPFSGAGTKTDTPTVETPQPITVVTDDVYLAQGAISVADTLRYVAGVQANSFGEDSRVDGGFIRGISALQFRDGMRDLFSYYASIRSDPYNFSQIEVVRGPASVLYGSGSIGGLINSVSKRPEFAPRGEIALRYGAYDRKEVLADIMGTVVDGLAGRIVARVRDADTQTDHVPDDRVMVAPSLLWQPGPDTSVTLLGLYQEDDGGSTVQFLPLVGTLYDNPNGKLPNSTFVGKPGWDRYDGRLLQGSAVVEHRFGEAVGISLKARYIDSDVTYFTHYPNSYSNPANPFLDAGARIIGNYASGSLARMNVFSTDNNVRVDFNTGPGIEHVLLVGADYSWNRVRKRGGLALERIDLYDIDYDALSDFGGGLPTADHPGFIRASFEDSRQRQLGFYLQDQIRFYDRVSLVLGVRRDHVRTRAAGRAAEKANATSFRAGIIGELVKGVSPFFSYTESFEPISGIASNGNPFVPKRGRQFEAGIKFHPDDATLITATAYHIRESNRPVDDPSTPDPRDQMQAGLLTSKGFEIEASRSLPGNFDIVANYSYNQARVSGSAFQLDNVPQHNASLWGTKSIALGDDAMLRIGAGVRHSGANYSRGVVRTPANTLVDALAELAWRQWRFSINATNLFDRKYYAACLARGDCFIGSERNVFGTLTYSF